MRSLSGASPLQSVFRIAFYGAERCMSAGKNYWCMLKDKLEVYFCAGFVTVMRRMPRGISARCVGFSIQAVLVI